MNPRRFTVALSFPGEHRDFVSRVADHLASTFGEQRVLYDKYHDAEFARVDLDVYLPNLYRTQSELLVVFLCPEYPAKRWCKLEWRYIRQLIATLEAERIMLLSFGDPGDLSQLGILPGDGYIDILPLTPDTVAEKIRKRLNLNQGSTPPPTRPVPVPAIAARADISRTSELISPQEFVDDKVKEAAIALNQARANKSLTMRTLIGTLDGLFDRNTFRREPSVGQCVTKEWDIRLHSALQTLRLLDDYAPFVKTEARRSWELYRELTAEVSRYGERMAAFLFDPPVGLAGLRNLVGTEGFIHAIQKHTKQFQGANVKVAPETCEIIDPHLKKAIDLMDTFQDEFCGPVKSPGTIPASPSDSTSSPVSSAAPPPSPALVTWQKKLAFLQTEEAMAADAEQKFSIQQRIEEARAKIRELGG